MKCIGMLFRGILVAVLVGALMAGCTRAARPYHFYTLSAMSETPGPQPIDVRTGRRPVVVGIGPVQIPEPLNRPQIVTRESPNRVELAEYDRWAGVLDREIARVVAENLSLLLDSDQMVAFPWEGLAAPTLRVALDIQRLDGRPGKEATLNVIWTIVTESQGEKEQRHRSVLHEAVSQESYASLVAAESRLLEALSREIAAAIRLIDLPKEGKR
jgi:uncharacterized lipoprotein YmbA